MQGVRELRLQTDAAEAIWPVMVCLLGNFRLLKRGQSVAVRGSAKTESLLCSLALSHDYTVSRDTLLEAIWPGSDPALAGKSLNTLVYNLHRLLGDELDGAAPVLHQEGCYRLNVDAGMAVDVACFEALARAGEQHAVSGDPATAAEYFGAAVRLYRGDLCGADVHAVAEREHLRARYLTLLARLAEYRFCRRDYTACLEHAQRLLAVDPYREDAHRLVMRCYVRRGERAQALRQYRLCEAMLLAEFEAIPEPATRQLFDQVRLHPSSI